VAGMGWCVMVVAGCKFRIEFSDILQECNGQYIISAATLSHVVDLTEMRNKVTQILATDADIDNLYVSDASQSHAFVYKVNGSFEYVRGFEFDEEQAKGGSGHRELLAIRLALSLDAEQFRKQTATKIFGRRILVIVSIF
jgi:hypothetical protein